MSDRVEGLNPGPPDYKHHNHSATLRFLFTSLWIILSVESQVESTSFPFNFLSTFCLTWLLYSSHSGLKREKSFADN